MKRILTFTTCALVLNTAQVHADAVAGLLSDYGAAGAGPFTAQRGELLWRKEQPRNDGASRSCTSCHTSNLRQNGSHAVTGKTIAPLAPSANPERLTDRREIEKWLMRNCKWTLGRECTNQEKGDFLSFLKTQ